MKTKIFFKWDENRNRRNFIEYNINFSCAKYVFYDSDAICFNDPDHPFGEERYLIIGYIASLGVYVVSYCLRDSEIIRIISARRATKKEKERYFTW